MHTHPFPLPPPRQDMSSAPTLDELGISELVEGEQDSLTASFQPQEQM